MLMHGGMYGYGYGIHQSVALALISLVAGYLACLKAHCTEHTSCKKVGKIVGGFVMIISVLLLVCLGYRCYRGYENRGKQCPIQGDHMHDDGAMPDEDAPAGK